MVAIVSLVSALAMTLVANAAPADIVARVPGPGEVAANLKFFPDEATTVGHLKTFPLYSLDVRLADLVLLV